MHINKKKIKPPVKITGVGIRRWRNSRGLRQEDLAKLLGVTENTVRRWELDQVQHPPYLKLALSWVELGIGNIID